MVELTKPKRARGSWAQAPWYAALAPALLFAACGYTSFASAAFVDETALTLPVDADNSYDFAIADVDGLGNPDLLVANGGQSRLLMNDGAGGFHRRDGNTVARAAAPDPRCSAGRC